MDNVSIVQILQSEKNLSDDHSGFDVIQPAAFELDEREQVTCGDELLEQIPRSALAI